MKPKKPKATTLARRIVRKLPLYEHYKGFFRKELLELARAVLRDDRKHKEKLPGWQMQASQEQRTPTAADRIPKAKKEWP